MESVPDSEDSSIYATVHEQFMNFKSYFKLQQISVDDEENDEPVDLEIQTKSKELLDKMQELINKKLEKLESTEAEFPRLFALKCTITFEMGRTLAYFGDEELGLKLMEEALELFAHHRHLPELSYLFLRICNSYSSLQTRLQTFDKAYDALEEARTVYRQITDGGVVDFYTIDEIFSEESCITYKSETKILLERLMTNNLELLGFVCNKLGRSEDYFKYTHEVLERQLLDTEMKPTSWATKAGRLAFGFMSHNRFWEARNHLAAAYHILNIYENQLQKELGDTEGIESKNEKLKHTQADIAKLWVKYCLYLLNASKKQLISTLSAEANDTSENMWYPRSTVEEEVAENEQTFSTTEPQLEAAVSEELSNKENEEAKTDQLEEQSSNNLEKVEEMNNNEEECVNANETKEDEDYCPHCIEAEVNEIPKERLLLFTTLPLGDSEDKVTANIIENIEQARAVVKFSHAWLRRSKTYYTIDQYPTEYINGILDLSDLYRYLAFFEEDMENQYMAQKTRADVLETLNMTLHELRPPCQLTITIELLRELAEVQLELVGLNLRRLFTITGSYDESNSERRTTEMLKKLGALANISGHPQHGSENFVFTTLPFHAFYGDENETL